MGLVFNPKAVSKLAKKAIIGASLAIDGEREFKKAVSDISKDMTVLSSEMKKVTAEFDDNAYSMEALTAKSAVYNKQIEAQKDRIDVLKKHLQTRPPNMAKPTAERKNGQLN